MGMTSATCKVCLTDPRARASWGCDEPTSFPQLDMEGCSARCGGAKDCPSCEGTNRTRIFDCPQKLVGSNETQRAIRAYFLYRKRILPVSGGWLDQTPAFLYAMEQLDRDHSEWSTAKEK